jgi:alkylation response protein AidB-like acyl-CoA dehydrogenase
MAPSTTTAVEPNLSAATVLDRAMALAPVVSARAAEIEAARRLPRDLVDDLVAAGCFRILLPPERGGAGATLAEAVELYRTLASGDASTGWTVMIGATAWCDLAALPRPSFEELFRPAADVIVAGAFAPSGTISPAAGGYELTGRWGFASGCQHATLFYANAVERFTDDGPVMRAAVLEPSEVAVEDTWDSIGLRGTGSHHFSVAGAVVASDRTFVPLADPAGCDATIVRIPTPTAVALCVAAVAVGAARGAVGEAADLAATKVPLLCSAPLATDRLFHDVLARADAGLAAAEALLVDVSGRLWQRAEAGDEVTLTDRARARSAASWATEAAVAATEAAYRAGGGSAVYSSSPLQRRMRDVHAITQHFIVRPDSFAAVGGVLAGQGLSVPVF